MFMEEMVVIFLHVITYDERNWSIKYDVQRLCETVIRHFYSVLKAVLKLWRILLKTPKPVLGNFTDERCKWFKVNNSIWMI